VAARFPNADQQDEGFVIADESRLATALDARLPGTGTPHELWLTGPPRAKQALRRAPFAALDVAARRDIERSLARDPLARGLELTLGIAALATLALAALGFWLALVSELRDERGELFDLEAQGVSPDTLRRQFRLRAAILVALGTLGGALLGLLLSRLVVALVRVSGATETAQPPLRFEPAWAAAAAGLGVLTVAAALVVELTTRHAFRGGSPERASWSLE
jgi:predicted lysophospholipase L1 biosynthesis ABC-type transport system permease subunit